MYDLRMPSHSRTKTPTPPDADVSPVALGLDEHVHGAGIPFAITTGLAAQAVPGHDLLLGVDLPERGWLLLRETC